MTTRVVDGKADLNGDLLAGAGGNGIASDDGRFAGLWSRTAWSGPRRDNNVDGLVGDVVIVGGLVDVDQNGTAGNGDTGMVPLASVLDTGSNTAAIASCPGRVTTSSSAAPARTTSVPERAPTSPPVATATTWSSVTAAST